MKKRVTFLSIVLLFALIASACAAENGEQAVFTEEPGVVEPGVMETEDVAEPEAPAEALETEPVETQPAAPESTPEDMMPTAAAAPEEGGEASPPPTAGTPESGGQDSEVQGAEVIPETGRPAATRLSTLLDYQVIDQEGSPIGAINDLLLNTCEAHLIYMVVEPAGELGMEEGGLLLIPFEAVTLEEGVIDAEQQTIQMNIPASGAAEAPTYDEKPDLSSTDWEPEVRDYWSQQATLSNLTTECGVRDASGELITRIAYADQVLGAELVDGTGSVIGQVEEVLQEPESGRLRYFAVQRDESLGADQPLALVPMRAVNLAGEETEGFALELLVEPAALAGAPGIDDLSGETDLSWNEEANAYWGQYVPLGEG